MSVIRGAAAGVCLCTRDCVCLEPGGKRYCTGAAVGREEKRERAKWLIFHTGSGGCRHSEGVQTASLHEGSYELCIFKTGDTYKMSQKRQVLFYFAKKYALKKRQKAHRKKHTLTST